MTINSLSDHDVHVLVGVHLEDPWFKETHAYPRLFSYVVDNPELADMWCTKQNMTKFPCEICVCPRENMNKIGESRSTYSGYMVWVYSDLT